MGLGIGGFTVPFDLLAETAPTRVRGLALCAVWLFWTLGSVALNLMAAHCLRDEDGPGGRDPLGWRWLTFLAAVPPLVALLGIPFVDESPSWLAARGRQDEARAIITRAAATNGVKLDPDFVVEPEPSRDPRWRLFDGATRSHGVLRTLNPPAAYYGVVQPRALGAARATRTFNALRCHVGVIDPSPPARTVAARCSPGRRRSPAIPVVLAAGRRRGRCSPRLVARGAANVAASLTWIVMPGTMGGARHGARLGNLPALATTYWAGAAWPPSRLARRRRRRDVTAAGARPRGS